MAAPDDTDEVRTPASWAALLPVLDPTTMGWRGRAFHIDPAAAAAVYDSAGNGRPTAWWNGNIVGRWTQRPDGTVVVVPLRGLPEPAATALQHELTRWLDGQVLRSGLQPPLG